MLQPVYCMRDVRVGFFGVTVDNNDATAARNFEHALTNVNSVLGTHPEDFDLYKIGVFDSEKGRIEPLDVPEQIAQGYIYSSGRFAKKNKKKGRTDE